MYLAPSIVVILGIITFVSHAGAENACEPLERLSNRVNYCDENIAYVAPARACLEGFLKVVKAENQKIQKTLNAVVKGAKSGAQDEDFATTMATLGSADATLTELIAYGKQTHTDIEEYGYDLVLPIYEAYPEDFNVDPWSQAGQMLFREKECYGEPAQYLDNAKAEIRPVVADLEKTQKTVKALFLASSGKKTNLNSVDPYATVKKPVGAGAATPVAKKGQNHRKKSTITGVEEDKAKSKKAK
jgi:hypothetical protein